MMQGTHGFLGRRGNCYLGEAPEISHKRAFLAKSVSEEKLRDGPLVFKWPENDIRDFDILQVRRDDGDPQAGSSERSEEHTSGLQSLMRISYAVFCLKKKKLQNTL